MKRFTPQNLFAAIAAFIAVLFFAQGGGVSGEGKSSDELEKEKE